MTQKCMLVLSGHEFTLVPNDRIVEPALMFKIRRIQFCGVYEVNPKVFFFTYQSGKTADTVQCHIITSKTKKETKIIANEPGMLFKHAIFSLYKRTLQE